MFLFYSAKLTPLAFQATRWLLLSLLLAAPAVTLAQNRAAVHGIVVATTQAPVEFATVTLHRAADSAVVKTEFSDAKGAFQLEGGVGERYRVSVAQVGLRRYWSPVLELPATGLALGAITLEASQGTVLQDVAVTGTKPLFERRPDRTVVNVADSPLSSGSTTLDVLSRSPGVTTDATGNLALRGRQGVLLVLDGKRVPLTGAELADYLRALPAEQLQSIDLITNPPASYDAQGGAGVIDIKLKKDQRLGTNGSANASYGRGEYGKLSAGLSLNHRRKNLNLYGTYAYTDRRGFERVDFSRQFAAVGALPAISTEQPSNRLTHPRSHSGKLGLDLTLAKRTQLGASVTGLLGSNYTTTDSHTQVFDAAGTPTDRFSSATTQDISRPSGSASLNLRHSFADSATARSLSADADYARYHTTRLTDLTTFFEAPTRPTGLLTGDQRSNLSIGAVKVDFSQPLPRRARLEAGAKVTRVLSDNDVEFANVVNGARTLNTDITSQFTYRENVNAAYVNLSGVAPKTRLQAGLRAEQTNTRAALLNAKTREQHYLQLFPSLLVERTLNERHALALAVARRVDRPAYGQVNPLRVYIDATSYRSGNPFLTASTSYSFELTHTYKGKFSTALAYARTDQPILDVEQPTLGRVVAIQDANLTRQHFYTLTFTAPLELTKWWTLYANELFYYNRFVANAEVVGTVLDRGRLACNLTLNNSFTLPHGWAAELNGLYESQEAFGFTIIRQRGQVGAGIQKSVWGKQGTLRLNVTDIFYTTPTRTLALYDNFTENSRIRQDLRVVTAAFTYRFGNSKVAAARRRAAGADEELRRAAGQ